MKRTLILLIIFAVSACSPAGLPQQPTNPPMDQTTVAIAAEATVTAIAAAAQPTHTLAAVVTEDIMPSPTVLSVPQTSDFWVTYITRNRLAAMNSDGSQAGLLTNTPAADYLPTWSPDGQKLGFIRFDASSRSDGVLHILPAGSSTPVPVDPEGVYNHFVWLPDNKTILATQGFSGEFSAYLVDTTGKNKPVLVAENITEVPALSPDGTKAILLVNTGPGCNGKGCSNPNDVHLLDIATRKSTRITNDELPKMAASWSPDGKQIAYIPSDQAGNIFDIMTPEGQVIGKSQPAPWWKNNWRISPDGKQVAYAVNNVENGTVDVYVRPIIGEALTQVAHIEKQADFAPFIDTLRWRPDGSGVVFNNWIKVLTANIDGSGVRELPIQLENVFFDVRPSASPFSIPPEPTAPASWVLCHGALSSRLDIGRRAVVSTNPPAPNNVRSGPTKQSELLGQIEPGEEVEITGGPVCDGSLMWWEVISLKTGLKGYTLEGDQKDYWLVPQP